MPVNTGTWAVDYTMIVATCGILLFYYGLERGTDRPAFKNIIGKPDTQALT